MGLPRLLGLCLAFLSVPALAADPPTPRGNVSTTVNPTTGYRVINSSTISTPPNVHISPIRDITPQVTRYTGGLQQTLPAGVTITGVKETTPLGASVRATTQTLKGGAKTLLKGNLATITLTAGLQQLLNGVEWILGEGGTIKRIETTEPVGAGNWCTVGPNDCGATPSAAHNAYMARTGYTDTTLQRINDTMYYIYRGDRQFGTIQRESTVCPSGYEWYPQPIDGCAKVTTVPVPPQDIDDAVDNNYDPDPADWPLLSPHFSPDDIEITSAPTLQGSPKTTTIYDADGNAIEVKETNIWFDFDIRDNPSPKPSLDLKTKEETKTYENGQLTSTTINNSTTVAGGKPPPPFEIPTDCDFMPTVCAFIDWFKEPSPELEQEQDLSQLINDEDFERSYTINFGVSSCPEPITINIIFLNKTVELSYEPACQLAEYAKPLVLISSYIFAIMITLGVVRNG